MRPRPAPMIANQLDDFQKASAGAIRVQELMSTRSALLDGTVTGFAHGAPEVEFRKVTFAYEGDDNVLHEPAKAAPLNIGGGGLPGDILGVGVSYHRRRIMTECCTATAGR